MTEVLHGRFFTKGSARRVLHEGFGVGLLLVSVVVTACGKRGPPLAPLRLVPEAPAEVSLRRAEDKALLKFTLPKKNLNGPGAVDLDRVEIYAVTAAPGAVVPRDRDLLTKKYLVGTITVKPPLPEDETPETRTPEEQQVAAKAAADTRPSPGDVVTFAEELSADTLEPALLPPAPGTAPAKTPGTAISEPPAAAGGPTAARPATSPVRIYAVRGLTRGGRPGAPAPRQQLPLVPLPSPPAGAVTMFDEKGVLLAWLPPLTDQPALTSVLPAVLIDAIMPSLFADREASRAATMAVLEALPVVPLSTALASPLVPPRPAAAPAAAPPAAAPSIAFNVYAPKVEASLNSAPLPSGAFQHAGVEFGKEQCFAITTVKTVDGVGIEGHASPPICVTPRDIFPPAPPTGLNAVAGPGAVNLIWNANTEPDLAGYLVLRGEVPGDTLQPLTPAPIHETNYRDPTVVPGVRYVYVVVAVDTASPPNASARTARVEETAR